MKLSDNLETNYRKGKTIDIIGYLKTMQTQLELTLKSSIDCFPAYEDVSEETRNDAFAFKAKLTVLKDLEYIDNEEYLKLVGVIDKIRLEMLEELEDTDGDMEF